VLLIADEKADTATSTRIEPKATFAVSLSPWDAGVLASDLKGKSSAKGHLDQAAYVRLTISPTTHQISDNIRHLRLSDWPCQNLWNSIVDWWQSSRPTWKATAASWALMRSGRSGLTERRAILDKAIAEHRGREHGRRQCPCGVRERCGRRAVRGGRAGCSRRGKFTPVTRQAHQLPYRHPRWRRDGLRR